MNKHKHLGFTLIEVMIAVAILAFALTALVRMVGQSANTLSYLEKKTFAQWVATNQINEIRVANGWPAVGRAQGEAMMAGVAWHWQVLTSETNADDLRRLDVTVMRHKQEAPVYHSTAFISRP